MNKPYKNYILYLILFLGYILLYEVKVDRLIYNIQEKESKSNVDFVYQQF
jgi:hypothetical protein